VFSDHHEGPLSGQFIKDLLSSLPAARAQQLRRVFHVIYIIRRLHDEIAFKYFEHPEGRGTRQLSTHTPALSLASTPLIRQHLNALHLCCVCTYTFYRALTRTPFVSFPRPQGIKCVCGWGSERRCMYFHISAFTFIIVCLGFLISGRCKFAL
jgi:hypothetical protein